MATRSWYVAVEQLEHEGVDTDTAFNMMTLIEYAGSVWDAGNVPVCTHTEDKKLVSITWDQGWWKVSHEAR